MTVISEGFEQRYRVIVYSNDVEPQHRSTVLFLLTNYCYYLPVRFGAGGWPCGCACSAICALLVCPTSPVRAQLAEGPLCPPPPPSPTPPQARLKAEGYRTLLLEKDKEIGDLKEALAEVLRMVQASRLNAQEKIAIIKAGQAQLIAEVGPASIRGGECP